MTETNQPEDIKQQMQTIKSLLITCASKMDALNIKGLKAASDKFEVIITIKTKGGTSET